MTLTDGILVLLIVLLLLWALYDEVIQDKRKGKTLLKIPLLRRNRVDYAIFIGLIAILVYQNVTRQGPTHTTWLLGTLALIAIYLGWLRQPKIWFKTQGFFYANAWIDYQRIKAINLSEDGVLVIQLEQRRLLIRVRNIDDLERIYKLLISRQ
ncbi:DUF986 family protein [Entomohabitans teleogrylli]|uniref:DUF986 family protein n=1 Tax=Entomohabitans teleogrylli TaxID=1384589 RepID=UPI00073D69BA|nr:DUF986 family protein [Entomohabitans teleogrylli]